MAFVEFSPPAILAPFVETYWTLSDDSTSASDGAGLIAPDGCVELLFPLTGTTVQTSRLTEDNTTFETRSFGVPYIQGIATRAHAVDYPRGAQLFGVRLRPAGALRLLGSDLKSLQDCVAPIREVLGNRLRELSARETPYRSEAISQRITKVLVAGLESDGDRVDCRLAMAMTAITEASGGICLSRLSRMMCVSSRQLDRWFDQRLGMSPKLYGRIARFRAAWMMGFDTPRGGWAAIASRCGYADQAHLCREFREFSGLTPTQIATRFG